MKEALNSPPSRTGQAMLWAAAAVIIIAGLKLGATVLAPLALALFLAFLSFPFVFWLESKGWPSWLATLTTLVTDVLLVGLLVFLLFVSVGDFDQALPVYQEKTKALYSSGLAWLEAHPWGKTVALPPDLVKPEMVFDFTRRGLGSLIDIFSNAALIFVIMLFALLEASSFPGKMRLLLGHSDGDPERFQVIVREIVQYLWIKTVVSIATGIFVGVGAWIIGVDFPVLWGLLTFALNYIPTIGSILPAIPSVLLALVQLGWSSALAFLGVTVAANIIFGNIVEPMMMGKRLGLSTLVVTLSLVFWGWIWGPIGMLLSIPLTMVCKIVAIYTPDLKWVAVLLSDGIPAAELAVAPETAAPGTDSKTSPRKQTRRISSRTKKTR